MAAMECGVDSVSHIGVNRLRAKSVRLGELLIELMASECADFGFELASPRDAERRGSHISWRHPEAYAISQALIAEGVVGDFRAPDLLRLGLAPAYLRFVDIWDAVAVLKRIMEEGRWDRPEYKARSKVT
jgi:kynureninase